MQFTPASLGPNILHSPCSEMELLIKHMAMWYIQCAHFKITVTLQNYVHDIINV